jgi:hypothetical protein
LTKFLIVLKTHHIILVINEYTASPLTATLFLLLAAFKMSTPADNSSPVLPPSVGQGPDVEDKGKKKVINGSGTNTFEPSPKECMEFGNAEDTCDKKEPKERSNWKRCKRFILKRVLGPACARVIIIFTLLFLI